MGLFFFSFMPFYLFKCPTCHRHFLRKTRFSRSKTGKCTPKYYRCECNRSLNLLLLTPLGTYESAQTAALALQAVKKAHPDQPSALPSLKRTSFLSKCSHCLGIVCFNNTFKTTKCPHCQTNTSPNPHTKPFVIEHPISSKILRQYTPSLIVEYGGINPRFVERLEIIANGA